jgi:uncharacterized protein YlxW (UPF0749 family)
MGLLRSRATLFGAVFVLGLAVAVAYNTHARAEAGRVERASSLVGIVRAMEEERAELEASLSELRESMALIEARAAEEAGLAESFGRELDEVRAQAGLVPVAGPGVIVTLGDAATVPPGQDPGACLVHDFDIASVVNALLAAGAEAVAVNDERVVSTTAVRCAGNTILVNSRRLGNPYTIVGIGSSEDLEQSLREDSSVAPIFNDYTAIYGLTATIVRSSEIEVPAYRGSLRTDYAQTVEDGG